MKKSSIILLILSPFLLYGIYRLVIKISEIKETIDNIRICTVEKANVRAGAGTEYPKNTNFQLKYGDTLQILKDSIGWIKFKAINDSTGWVKKDLTMAFRDWTWKLEEEKQQKEKEPSKKITYGKITVIENGVNNYGKKLMERLQYLNDVKEITWVEIEKNVVYIGFDPVPADWQLVIRAAALHGNKVIGFGTHVWATYGDREGWRPGDSSYLGEITARHGRIEE